LNVNAISSAERQNGMKDQCLPGHRSSIFDSSFQAHVTIKNTIHHLGAWIRLNKKTILASVQHQDQWMGRTTRPSQQRSSRAPPTHRSTASLPRAQLGEETTGSHLGSPISSSPFVCCPPAGSILQLPPSSLSKLLHCLHQLSPSSCHLSVSVKVCQ
jgi:hypothetical protein